ncbi:type II secretion system secretin GspD [Pseudoxanthomonas indica]|uniref:Type II secretion system protein D (GspD) n=1 Tax=Pseudoxanthomonas indica TaxID=428993 RepID=A0A1T5LHB4_9GAMM|nr:type II secretion system secretin GspD [Pseudoxanthomonas indica]GGD34542.1 type II secretion system protein D [Pseudoxanthomonas indica]SKC74748.1 type II secretion system protein D (GspD) [Pseudoxanthomonas indica]
MTLRLFLVSLCIGTLAACATPPTPEVRRGGPPTPTVSRGSTTVAADGSTIPSYQQTCAEFPNACTVEPLPPGSAQTVPLTQGEAPEAGPQAVIRRGSGQMINRSAAAAPMPSLAGASSGSASFNFEGESVHAVVKAILGDMLGQNYVIAPGVQGTVTLGTPKPVSAAQAMTLLEQVLAQNNARMVYSDGRYNIMPADQAMVGTVAPRTGSAGNARGYEVRVVPLRYIGATEMKKVLEPYARPNAIVNIDSTRNLITLAGTRSELENYLRTVEVFDVDWLSNMSVGVFPLETGQATKVVADLEKVFGADSKTPSAGMFRFMPLEGANAVLVITPQPSYLDQIQQWLERIDSAGEGSRLYSYELKYIKARDLAQRLAEVFGSNGSRNGDSSSTGGNASLIPGSEPTTLSDSGMIGQNDSSGLDSGGYGGGSTGGSLGGGFNLSQRRDGNGAVTLQIDGDRVGVAAVEETNTLLVRSSASAWKSIKDVVEKLDVMPMQVHIEAQVAEVKLSGDLSYGVNWFFENAVTDEAGLASALGRQIWGDISGSIRGDGQGLGWTFLGKNAAAIIEALEEVTDVQLLQTPSVLVRNNAEATLNVGTKIPITSVSVNPDTSNSSYSSVQYLDTGVILKVRPRITKDGIVFLDLVQEVSSPGPRPANCGDDNVSCNVPIDTRRLKTEAAVQSGDTIMLAGLIGDSVDNGSSGIPYLARVPIIGGLFGSKRQNTDRQEVIILITPTIVRNPQEARNLTDEYGRRFRAMEPLYAPKAQGEPTR